MKSGVFLTLLLFVLSVFYAVPTVAGTYVDLGGDVGTEQRIEREFSVRGDGKLKLTVACREEQSGHLRVYFYQRSPAGGWSEIDRLRIIIRESTDPTSGEFELPAGTYMMVVSIRRMNYSVKLEDAGEE